ncbi:pneumococcal serine-rich repeat protein-like [Macrobrachium rosenbergii]|uniref:pneumococcal serine-rich repeat protein-like n=1 Tax=Macrobrachium rosenbergii TaxID=79674 RepID=UPI0034D3E2B6
MEGRVGGAKTLPRSKGATLPGYRVGSVRYGVRLAPPDAQGCSPSPLRRCSEGDAANRANLNCDGRGGGGGAGEEEEEESLELGGRSRRALLSFAEDEEVGEAAAPSHHVPSPSCGSVASAASTAPPAEATNALGTVSHGSSPLVLKEAHSLLNHKRTLLTVPSLSPHALPPVSPRPHSRRRSFNALPRPWVAPHVNHGATAATTTAVTPAATTGTEDVSDRCREETRRWHTPPIDGVSGATNTSASSSSSSSSTSPKINLGLYRGNGSSPSPSSSSSSSSFSRKEPRPASLPPPPPAGSPGDVATFRSEATILVTRGGDEGLRRREASSGVSVRSPISRRRGVGTLSLAKNISNFSEPREEEEEEEEEEEGVGVGGDEEDESVGGRRQVATGATTTTAAAAAAVTAVAAAPGGAALVEEVKVGGLLPPPPHGAKYTCCVAGRSPRQLLPRHATMFSYPGPPRPAIPEEPDSAHLTSDQCSALFPKTPSHAHGTTGQTTVLSGRCSESVASGGSGHRDRVAPPAPVTISITTTNITTTPFSSVTIAATSSSTSSAAGSPTTLTTTTAAAATATATAASTTAGEERKQRRPVRPKPEIPDHLYRRWAALLPPPHGGAADVQQPKQKQQNVRGSSDTKGATGGTHRLSDEGPLTAPFDFHPPASGTPRRFSSDQLDLQSDIFQNFAQLRLGIPTGDLGGGRREGGRGPPPSRPPRSRQDHLEKLRKCTERLKTPSPDKKARGGGGGGGGDALSTTDATAAAAAAAAAGGSDSGVPPRSHKSKKRSSETRGGAMNRHPSLGKSPSLPTQLPSSQNQDDAVKRLSPLPAKENSEAPLPPSHRREDEDVFNETIAKLPPLPRPETRLVIPPRVIPFRSASVSQVDVRSDGSFCGRSSKSPIATRLYPFCKDYWGSNTLPRCKPPTATGEGESEGSASQRSHHPPLTAAASISDMTNVGGKGASSPPEKLENKSKSESELSLTTHNNNNNNSSSSNSNSSGSPKVDLLELCDNILPKKVEASEAAREGRAERGVADDGCQAAVAADRRHADPDAKDQSQLDKVNNERNAKELEGKELEGSQRGGDGTARKESGIEQAVNIGITVTDQSVSSNAAAATAPTAAAAAEESPKQKTNSKDRQPWRERDREPSVILTVKLKVTSVIRVRLVRLQTLPKQCHRTVMERIRVQRILARCSNRPFQSMRKAKKNR